MSEKPRSLRIDVRQPDDVEAHPWEGSVNIPVYQMDFVEKVTEAADRETALSLLGYREDLSAPFARDKLLKYGFSNVAVAESESSSTETVSPVPDGTHPVDREKSRVGWTGRNIASSHFGSIPLLDGELSVKEGRLESFSLTVDMTRITCEDIEDRSTAEILEAHLKNEDFFEADRYPIARFVSSRVEPLGGADSPRVAVTGELEIRGKLREVSVEGVFGTTFDGMPAASAHFEIDRTEWGAVYGSPRFFRRLMGHFVREEVSLAVVLVAG